MIPGEGRDSGAVPGRWRGPTARRGDTGSASVPPGPPGAGPTADGGHAPAGFTLIQMILLLALVGLAAGLLLPLGSRLLEIQRSHETRGQLQRLKTALVGSPEAADGQLRRDFGFLGDFGELPDSLIHLVRQGGLSGFSLAAKKRVGAGWRGPYHPVRTRVDTVDALRDAFGRRIRYTIADTSAGGVVWDAYLRSAGPDGRMTTSGDNVTVPIRRSETTADTVRGVVADTAGTPLDNVAVTLTYRRNGVLVDSTVFTDSEGRYRFLNIPMGRTLLRLGQIGSPTGPGRIELVPGSAIATTIQGDESVQFEIFNPGETEVVVDSLKAEYDETAFYRWIFFDQPGEASKEVFDAEEQGLLWPGSGDWAPFKQSDTIPPAGAAAESDEPIVARLVLVDGPEIVADSLFGPSDAGGVSSDESTVVQLRKFLSNELGIGSPVDMAGVSFTVTFSDGSVVSFTAQ